MTSARRPQNAAEPRDSLHELHKEAMKAYSFETRNTSLLGGQSPKEVVLTGQYVALNVENTDVKKDGETSSPILENTLTAVLSPSKDMTRLVMLFGPTGVGKTTAVQKMLLDWTGGKHLQQFGFVFPFAFRQLNVLKQEMTLEELLLNQHGHLAPESLGLILQTPQSLLFVFDGLEQYQHQLDVLSDSGICSQPNQAAPVPVLVSSLVHGALLQGASILVTARTRSELNSSSEVDCKHVEVSGFSVDQRKIYIDQFFKNPENAEKAFQHIEQKIGFQDICRLPVFCWITCTLLKAALEASQDLPETLTQVFVSAFVNLIHAHALGKTAARDLMLGLGRMAAHGLQNNAVVSSQKEMAAFGLQQFLTSPVLLGFLSFEGDPTSDNCTFSFRLPAVQDFLVAVSYYLDISEGKSLEEVLGRLEGRAALLKIFLSGLSSALQRKPLEGVVGEFSSDRHSEFTGWLRNSTEEAFQSWSKERRLCSIRLLHQCQNQPLVKEITAKLGCSLGASFEELTVWDAVALNYVVMCCGNLQDLNLYGNRSLTEDITQRLVPAFSYSHKLMLSSCMLSAESFVHLASALVRGTTVEVDLSYCRTMDDAGAKALCVGLRQSSLQILRLPSCGLTAASCDDLASVLAQESSQLRLLDLRANKLEDEGLIQLCRGLSSPHCKLQQLGLDFCHLAGESMGALSQALCTGHSEIRSLNLNRNNLTDAGLESLTRVLRNSESKLQHLLLSDCNLTKACCEGLAEALRSGCCSLIELDLSCSDLEDSGGLKLCEALKTHGCPLEVLRLVRCELGQATFQELGSILRSGSSKLKHLEVGLNNVGDEGAKYLWEALADSRCRLEILDMEMVTLTDNSLEDICSALRANHCLKELVLKNNGLTDTSVPSLVQLMQDSRTMQAMNLQYNDFSEDVFETMESCGKIKY